MTTTYIPEIEENGYKRLERLMARSGITHPLICDVGANIGQSINKFKKSWPEAKIYAFEANPDVFQELKKNHCDTSGVELQDFALSDQIGEVSFYATRIREASSLLSPSERIRNLSTDQKYDYEKLIVHSETLDHFFQNQHLSHIDLLKIDVQGAELSVLKGAKELLMMGAVSFVYLEMTFADNYENQSHFIDILNFLHQTGEGYELWDIAPFLYTSRDQLWASNSTFLAKSVAAKILQ